MPHGISQPHPQDSPKRLVQRCPNLQFRTRKESVERLPAGLIRFEVEVAAAVGGDRMPLSQMQGTALFCATLTCHILSHPSSVKQPN